MNENIVGIGCEIICLNLLFVSLEDSLFCSCFNCIVSLLVVSGSLNQHQIFRSVDSTKSKSYLNWFVGGLGLLALILLISLFLLPLHNIKAIKSWFKADHFPLYMYDERTNGKGAKLKTKLTPEIVASAMDVIHSKQQQQQEQDLEPDVIPTASSIPNVNFCPLCGKSQDDQQEN